MAVSGFVVLALWTASTHLSPNNSRLKTIPDETMFQKRRLTNSGAAGSNADQNRCKRIQCPPRNQPFNCSNPSKEAESRRCRKDPPRCCKRVRRLVPSPHVRPRWSERAHQALRGIGRIDGHRTQLTRMLAGIRRCQGEDRGPQTAVGQVQAKCHHDNCRRRPWRDGATEKID